jgi:hypothetical protein
MEAGMEHRAAGKLSEAASLVRISNCFSPAREETQIYGRFLLDTSLSSTPISSVSTRHSVTSRIDRNSRPLCHLTFSTRHLNATLEKRGNVEIFNTRVRFFAASDSLPNPKIARAFSSRKNSTSVRAARDYNAQREVDERS